MLVSYGKVIQGRDYISQFIKNKKEVSNFSVIDIGGAVTGWTSDFADVFVDINKQNTNKLQFNFDICVEENWKIVLDYVEKNGKFDYSICTHTLEDIYNPYLVLKYLPKISKQGIVSMPSVYTEINFVENKYWSGYIHHRYLFGYKNDKMVIVPKLPIIEHLQKKVEILECLEIKFEWRDSISYSMFLNNYLGPDPDTVLFNYETFIKEQMEQINEQYFKHTP